MSFNNRSKREIFFTKSPQHSWTVFLCRIFLFLQIFLSPCNFYQKKNLHITLFDPLTKAKTWYTLQCCYLCYDGTQWLNQTDFFQFRIGQVLLETAYKVKKLKKKREKASQDIFCFQTFTMILMVENVSIEIFSRHERRQKQKKCNLDIRMFVVQSVVEKCKIICLGFCCNKKRVENLFILKQVS